MKRSGRASDSDTLPQDIFSREDFPRKTAMAGMPVCAVLNTIHRRVLPINTM